jgi:hypothetical protein
MNRMRAPKNYHSTAKGLMMWANSELEHVGRIAAVEDPDLQYSYAMSTLNGMAHLKDALYEFVVTEKESHMKNDILKIHDSVVRVMKHLVKTYSLRVKDIVKFNTRHTLSSLNYLKEDSGMRGGMCGCMMARGGRRNTRDARRALQSGGDRDARRALQSGGDRDARRALQSGGDGQETTDYTVQGVPVTKDDNSVVVIGDYGPVTAKEFKNIMEDREAGRLD